jgi:L-galactose dehydrogenase
MDYVTFGRTGMQVSAVGLGTGGASKIGIGTGADEQQAVDVIHRAIELGITYFDTAKGYGTEGVVGKGLLGSRDKIILSSKTYVSHEGEYVSADGMREAIDDSLRQLQTEMIDVYHLHRLTLAEYDYAIAEILPVLDEYRDQGKIRFIGMSESTSTDANHQALERAAIDNNFDVMMTGLNFFNQGSCENVLPLTIKNDIAVEIMGSARGPYSNPVKLREETAKLIASGELSDEGIDLENPLGFLLGDGHAGSLAEASYRLTRYEPGVHVVLVGTGNVNHLEENIVSLHKGPLPVEDRDRARELFGHLRVSRELS